MREPSKMIELMGVALMLSGLGASVSTFPMAMRAARGEGPQKLAPLSVKYWTGLACIAIGTWCQAQHQAGVDLALWRWL
jgi:hypothetical protein